MPRLEHYFLGPFRVTSGGEPLSGFATDKVRALLAYLAVEGNRAHRREALAGLLWPNSPDSDALTSLRQALHKLRQVLGLGTQAATGAKQTAQSMQDTPSELLLITPQAVQFKPGGYYLDVDEFRGLVRDCHAHRHRKIEHCSTCHTRLLRAAELYGGDFLAGFLPEDTEAFDEWLILTREGLRRQALEVFAHLGRYYEAHSEHEQAIHYAYRQIEMEPWREDVHRQAMRLLATTGQRNAALAQYESCRRVLLEELGIEPEGETHALYELIKAGDLGTLLQTEYTTLRHNLPQQLTPFVGREEELARLTELLDGADYRLITLVGQGGAGKTRLSIQAASAQARAFDDGICFVPLAGIGESELLASSIAQALDFRFEPTEQPEKQLLDYLRHKEMLLVLDNFEHLLDTGTPLLLSILKNAPQLMILVTSRERLGLQAEYVLDVEGLRLPGVEDDLSELMESGAVRLFVERAQQIQSRFVLSPDNAGGVIDICRLVAGLPLGIVLAAAWLRHFPPARIASSLLESLDFLATSARDASPQHASLRAVFNHSWGLLSEEEKQVFRRLSVFRGGWEEDAAEKITGASLDSILALADKSLLRQDESGRFDIHQVLHQYAAEQLDLSPVERSITPARHADYFVHFAEQAAEQLHGSDQGTWLERLDQEHSNMRAALAWGKESGDAGLNVRMCAALWRFWYVRGHYHEGLGHLRETLGIAERQILGEELVDQNEDSASHIPRSAFARSYYGAGLLARTQGSFAEATDFLDKGLKLYRQLDDKVGIANALNVAGVVAHDQGDYTGAGAFYSESLAVCREIEDKQGVLLALNNLGNVATEQQEYAVAKSMFEESLVIGRETEDKYGIALSLASMGTVAWYQHDYQLATALLQEGLKLHHELGDQPGMIHCLETLGKVAASLGIADRAARLWGAAAALREVTGSPLTPTHRAAHESSVAAARETVGNETFEAAWAEGHRMSIEDIVTYAVQKVA